MTRLSHSRSILSVQLSIYSESGPVSLTAKYIVPFSSAPYVEQISVFVQLFHYPDALSLHLKYLGSFSRKCNPNIIGLQAKIPSTRTRKVLLCQSMWTQNLGLLSFMVCPTASSKLSNLRVLPGDYLGGYSSSILCNQVINSQNNKNGRQI